MKGSGTCIPTVGVAHAQSGVLPERRSVTSPPVKPPRNWVGVPCPWARAVLKEALLVSRFPPPVPAIFWVPESLPQHSPGSLAQRQCPTCARRRAIRTLGLPGRKCASTGAPIGPAVQRGTVDLVARRWHRGEVWEASRLRELRLRLCRRARHVACSANVAVGPGHMAAPTRGKSARLELTTLARPVFLLPRGPTAAAAGIPRKLQVIAAQTAPVPRHCLGRPIPSISRSSRTTTSANFPPTELHFVALRAGPISWPANSVWPRGSADPAMQPAAELVIITRRTNPIIGFHEILFWARGFPPLTTCISQGAASPALLPASKLMVPTVGARPISWSEKTACTVCTAWTVRVASPAPLPESKLVAATLRAEPVSWQQLIKWLDVATAAWYTLFSRSSVTSV